MSGGPGGNRARPGRPDGAIFLRGLAGAAAMTGFLLLVGGGFSYRRALVFGLVNVGVVIGLAVAFAGEWELVRERMRRGPGTKWWDRVFWGLYGPLNLAVVLAAAIGGGRGLWGGPAPWWVSAAGYVLYLPGATLHLWAVRANPFYAGTVRIQEERGQEVIAAGPYAIVRHPGYTGIVMMMTGMALALGSLVALLPAAGVALLLVARTALEDRTLRRELPGYEEYAGRIRFRLLPGLW